MNPDVEVSSEISLSQNTCKEVMSRRTRNTYLASDTEAVITDKKNSEHPSWFFATGAATKKHFRKRRLKADGESKVSEDGSDKYADFKRFRAVLKHDAFKWDALENLA